MYFDERYAIQFSILAILAHIFDTGGILNGPLENQNSIVNGTDLISEEFIINVCIHKIVNAVNVEINCIIFIIYENSVRE